MDKRFHTLDGMRGIAAMVVVCYHLVQRQGSISFPGYLAVDFFFLLSGFVIAFNYQDKLARGLPPGRFMALRLVRLFPLYAAGFALGIGKQLVAAGLHDVRAMDAGTLTCNVAFGATMLPSPCDTDLFPLNMPTWSLFFELAINAAFALLLWRFKVPMLAILMALAAAFLASSITPPLYMDVGWLWGNTPLGIARTAVSFIGGMLVYRLSPLQHRRASWLAPAPILLLTALLLVPLPADGTRIASEAMIVFAAFPALLLAGIYLEARPAFSKPFGVLGDMSYPLYVLHAPLIALFLPILARLGLSTATSTAIFTLLMLPIAYGAAKLDSRTRAWIGIRLNLRRA